MSNTDHFALRQAALPRRAFLTRMLAVAGVASLLEACSPATPAAGPTTAPAPTAAPKPTAAPAPPTTAAPTAAALTKPAPTTAPVAPTAAAAATTGFQPTKRGGGGTLKILFWQPVGGLNAHTTTSNNLIASRLFNEPLATFDPDGNLIPILAAELPTFEANTLDRAGKWVTWKLKKGVVWHDGEPVTADDVIFTWEYTADPASTTTTRGSYENIATIDKVDDLTVKITFKEATPFWQAPFVGSFGAIVPKHVLLPYKGANNRNAPFNLKPIGTGPYKVVDFRPDNLLTADINDTYHVPNRPFFDHLELKSGGDATEAARAVLQTGEYDIATNLSVDKDVLANLANAGVGKLVFDQGVSTELIQLNFSDPYTEVNGEAGNQESKHPMFSDIEVRKAVSMAINRPAIVDGLYGAAGEVGTFYINGPKRYLPDTGAWTFDLQKAGQVLDAAGWVRGSDGVRAKNGVRMKVLYQTTVSPVRQNIQAIIKKDLETLGFQVDLKQIPSSAYFSNDPANPDTWQKFSADIEEFSSSVGVPDPLTYLAQYTSAQIAQKANGWAFRNSARYSNAEFDKLWAAANTELDPDKRTGQIKRMVQILFEDVALQPLVHQHPVAAVKNGLQGIVLHAFDANLGGIPYWYRA